MSTHAEGHRYIRQYRTTKGTRWALWQTINGRAKRVGTATTANEADAFIGVTLRYILTRTTDRRPDWVLKSTRGEQVTLDLDEHDDAVHAAHMAAIDWTDTSTEPGRETVILTVRPGETLGDIAERITRYTAELAELTTVYL